VLDDGASRGRAPRIFVPVPSEALRYVGSILETGAEPMVLGLPMDLPTCGAALRREWVADWAEVYCSSNELDALLLSAAEPAELAGLLIAALRLDLPAVVVPTKDPFSVALAALGFAPLDGDAAEIAVELARTGRPQPGELVEGFSLANALRAGLASGAGPELLVHLAAIAREAGVVGFPQMIRVLAPESPEVAGSSPFEALGAAELLAHLGDALHDNMTVTGRLKANLPSPFPALEAAGSRLVFVRGRASGTEIVCRGDEGVTEISGDCHFYSSEEAAVRAVESGVIGPSGLLVVVGCGPRGGPGLFRLDRLGSTLRETDLNIPVLTDGLPPENTVGTWASLATPEATMGGVIGRLRDGDALRLDLTEGLLRTGAKADEIRSREPFPLSASSSFGYTARYAHAALPALEGAGFG
jgi:dihydroxy-acid dehydratase